MEKIEDGTPISPKDMLMLSELYRKGTEETKDLEEARKWIMKAAESNDCTAMELLAMDYLNGNELYDKDIKKALFWFEKAATNGSSDAQVFYGIAHLLEIGKPFNPMIGMFWLKQAAKRGNTDANEVIHTFFDMDEKDTSKVHFKKKPFQE